MVELKFFKVYTSFFNFLDNLKNELIIICPYIKINALKKILEKVPKKIKVIIIARWRLEDLVMGSSDLEIYNYLKTLNYKFYINKNIHLKILVKDKKELIIGSANITNSGLGFIKDSNIEAVSINNLNEEYLFDILKILKLSTPVDDNIFNFISEKIKEFDGIKNLLRSELKKMDYYDKNIEKKEKNILVADFPFCDSPKIFLDNYKNKKFEFPEMIHDMLLFNLSKNESLLNLKSKLKISFLSSDSFMWQNSIIKNEMLFGEYSSILHDSLMDDPKPYRKRVKELVNIMFKWSNEFSLKFKIKKYSHSHSLCRI